MPIGVVSLGSIATRLPTLGVACNDGVRRGRLHTRLLSLGMGRGCRCQSYGRCLPRTTLG